MTDREPRQTPSLEEVTARLKAVQEREAQVTAAEDRRKGKAEGLNIGMRIGIELLASVLVGGGLGLFIDSKLHTKPIFLLALISLGFTAGVMNVLRLTKRLDVADHIARGKANETPAAPAADDDE